MRRSLFYLLFFCINIILMKVMLLGAGAVGAPLCTRLTKASELYLIMDDKRAEGYKGIIVNGLHYQIPLAKKGDKADLIILACKNFDLDNAISEIREHVRDNTIIMSLLNGVESEKHLEEAFPNAHVIYSFITSLSSNRDGNIINCYSENGGIIFLGEKNGTKTEELEKVISLFDMCNVTYQVSDNIIKEIWWKFMLNCAFNSLSGILETTYRKMYDNQMLLMAAQKTIDEVIEVANAEGVNLTAKDGQRAIDTIKAFKDDGKTSLLQDIENKRMTENIYFTYCVSTLGKKHKISTPVCDLLYLLVEAKSYAKK